MITQVLFALWQKDPLFVIALGIIALLLVYLEIMHLRLQLLANALHVMSTVLEASDNGSHGDGGGCIMTLFMLILSAILFAGIFTLLFL